MVKRIVKGHVREIFNEEEKLSNARMEICRACPLYIETFIGEICNRYKWINPETGEVSDEEKESYVRGCGCRLNAKTRNPEDTCVINKW